MQGKRFPPYKLTRYMGPNRDRERGPLEIKQQEIMHHLVKKGMCWREGLVRKVRELARKDDELFSRAL